MAIPEHPPSVDDARLAVRVWVAFAAIVSLFIGAGFMVRVPYRLLGPGPTTNVLEKITAEQARTYPSRGQLLLTTATVSNDAVTVWDLIAGWADRAFDLVPQGVLRRSCQTGEEEDAENDALIEQSKIEAELAAFRALGHAVAVRDGARVLAVQEGAPAHGKLRAGDVVVAVDGTAVDTVAEVGAAIRRRALRAPVRVTVQRDGERRTFSMPTQRQTLCEPDPRPTIGVHLMQNFSFPLRLSIDTGTVGGPSGGLVFTLALIDAFSEEDLTRGHIVAVTGTIHLVRRLPDGTGEACIPSRADPSCRVYVGPIGGIEQKVAGAAAAGATVFLVPASEAEAAAAAAPAGMRVIGVRTLDDALRGLRALPALATA